jgi:hypothetical protein
MSTESSQGLLVAILPRHAVLDILKTERWYNIPVVHAPGAGCRKCWRFIRVGMGFRSAKDNMQS